MFDSIVSYAEKKGLALPAESPDLEPCQRAKQRCQVVQAVLQSLANQDPVLKNRKIKAEITGVNRDCLNRLQYAFSAEYKSSTVFISPFVLIKQAELSCLGERALQDPATVARFIRNHLGFKELDRKFAEKEWLHTALLVRGLSFFAQQAPVEALLAEEEALERQQSALLFVFGHELGHLRNGDGSTRKMIPELLLDLLFLLILSLVFSAALAALLVCSSPLAVLLVLPLALLPILPLSGVNLFTKIKRNHAEELSADAFAAQLVGPEGGILQNRFLMEAHRGEESLTHPSLSERIRRLEALRALKSLPPYRGQLGPRAENVGRQAT